MFNIGSTVTVKCSKVETKNISWHNGITGVKIKSGGRMELNGLSLKIKKTFSLMMQEHMSAEENQALGSTLFMPKVSFLYALLFITSPLFSSRPL